MPTKNVQASKIRTYKFWLLALWLLIVAISFGINDYQINENALAEAHLTANVHYQKDVLYRKWSSIRGGVYAPIDSNTQPNPYLNYIQNRDVEINGKPFTLVNPAYMTRQVYELAKQSGIISSRLLSDRALNPQNQAKGWELSAINELNNKVDHKDTIVEIDGNQYLKVLRPFFTEKSCLKCHQHQGYKEGDLRGAILINVPMKDINERYAAQETKMILALSGIFLLGFILIYTGGSKIEKDFIKIATAEKSLTESEQKIQTYVKNAPNLILLIDEKGIIQFTNRTDDGSDPNSRIGKSVTEFITKEVGDSFLDALAHPDKIDFNKVLEYQDNRNNKNIWYENRIAPIKSAGKITGYVIIASDITERKLLDEKLKNSLSEKEVLLKEVHHRVKNNLQIITSLLNLQSALLKDDKMVEVFKDSQNRIKSMALIHELMYQSGNFSHIDTRHYFNHLVSYLYRSYCADGERIRIVYDIEEVSLGMDTMIPCGIIVAELVTNSLKYGFPDNRNGEVKISLHELASNKISLVVADNGIGVTDSQAFTSKKTLGLQLVETLTGQLDGELSHQNSKEGLSFQIVFRKG